MSDHQPRRRDKFHDANRAQLDKQPNGKIIDIDWEMKEVTVQFLDDDYSRQYYDFDEIEDHYHPDLHGGIYMIPVIVPRSTRQQKK